MKYRKSEAKDYAQSHLRGIWCAASTPFNDDYSINESGFAGNIGHWINDLGIEGVFVSGKQGEFYAMSIAERKRTFDIAQEVCNGRAGTMMSCSDQNMDVVLELAKHAEGIGADYIIVHAPVLHFVTDVNETLFQYYQYISEKTNLAIAIWSHPDSGYLMSPQLCARIAELPNVVAIKYSVPREMYTELTRLAGDKLLISNPSEEHWLDNIKELGWRLYLCASAPYLLQTKFDRRMREYTDLAFAGDFERAREVRDSLNPVRQALKSTQPRGKHHAHQKCWQELLGQKAGAVRRPMLPLTDSEKASVKQAFGECGLKCKG